jgi:pSer/pThr/pTyr-binding forkhead associated (FHA) protein
MTPNRRSVAVELSLTVTAGPLAGRRIEVPSGGVVLGRTVDGQGRIATDDALSKRHAEFFWSSAGFLVVRDLGSTNGTYVNGVRIRSPQALGPGDVVHVGGTVLEVDQAPEASTMASAPPRSVATHDGVVVHGGQHAGPGGVVAGRDIRGGVQTHYTDQRRYDLDATGWSLVLRARGFARFLIILGIFVGFAGAASFGYPIVRAIVEGAESSSDLGETQAECRRKYGIGTPEFTKCSANSGFEISQPDFQAAPWIPLGVILVLVSGVLTTVGILMTRHDRDDYRSGYY